MPFWTLHNFTRWFSKRVWRTHWKSNSLFFRNWYIHYTTSKCLFIKSLGGREIPDCFHLYATWDNEHRFICGSSDREESLALLHLLGYASIKEWWIRFGIFFIKLHNSISMFSFYQHIHISYLCFRIMISCSSNFLSL